MSEYITPTPEGPKLNNAAPLINNYPINNNEKCSSDSNDNTNDNENCYPEYKTNDNINYYPEDKTNDNENCYTDYKTKEYNKDKKLLKDKQKISPNCKLIFFNYKLCIYIFNEISFLIFNRNLFKKSIYCFYFSFYYWNFILLFKK